MWDIEEPANACVGRNHSLRRRSLLALDLSALALAVVALEVLELLLMALLHLLKLLLRLGEIEDLLHQRVLVVDPVSILLELLCEDVLVFCQLLDLRLQRKNSSVLLCQRLAVLVSEGWLGRLSCLRHLLELFCSASLLSQHVEPLFGLLYQIQSSLCFHLLVFKALSRLLQSFLLELLLDCDLQPLQRVEV